MQPDLFLQNQGIDCVVEVGDDSRDLLTDLTNLTNPSGQCTARKKEWA
ncbi:MAG TPA: hypothetical protein VH280_00025 [Verrucomicrobiae bacterium]|nr:hypothetical protein [Verrucomicrobiae bacterium]